MNSYGQLFRVTLYGESHQPSIGVVIDGLPAGTPIQYELIKEDLERRKPKHIGSTPRLEADVFHITSGVFNDKATGSPIHVYIENKNVISKDYDALKNHPRPGHADFVSKVKYHGFQDHRGGGRFSGRLTAALVVAGSFAKMALPFQIESQLKQIGTLTDMSKIDEYLTDISNQGDSVGGIVEVTVKKMIIGLGEPFFNKLDAELAKLLFSVPAVKGVEFGLGFSGVDIYGSQFNDVILTKDGQTKTNNSGGLSGGISNGNDLVVKIFVKPTSSIKKTQETYNFEQEGVEKLNVGGRHDVAIVRRVSVVLENMIAIGLLDQYLLYQTYRHLEDE
ncbi:MAG: chorismate synthase [Acholeplasmataceae bacterium]|nr:chorismate synthase [Acholeplasmataceae bacterium]